MRKSKFSFNQISLFGYVSENTVIKPDPDHTAAFKTFPASTNKKSYKQVLG